MKTIHYFAFNTTSTSTHRAISCYQYTSLSWLTGCTVPPSTDRSTDSLRMLSKVQWNLDNPMLFGTTHTSQIGEAVISCSMIRSDGGVSECGRITSVYLCRFSGANGTNWAVHALLIQCNLLSHMGILTTHTLLSHMGILTTHTLLSRMGILTTHTLLSL